MNATKCCHQIEGCPNLFIDAFSIFRHKTTNKYCSFILTHYHSDHYHGLPRDGKYVGPALIHW